MRVPTRCRALPTLGKAVGTRGRSSGIVRQPSTPVLRGIEDFASRPVQLWLLGPALASPSQRDLNGDHSQTQLLARRKGFEPPLAAAPLAAAAANEDELTIPSDINTVFLAGLFLLATLAACYVAAEIVLPLVLAFVLSLVLQPAMRVFERVRVRRGIAAILLIFLLFGTLGGLGTALSGPATSWAQKLPTGIPKLEERLSFLSRPIAAFQKFADQAQGMTLGGEPKAVP